MTGARPAISVVGPFPPPVQGAAEVTRLIAGALDGQADVERLSTAPAPGSRGIAYHVSRIRRVCAAAVRLASGRGVVYLSAAGGRGLGYDIMLIAIARLVRRPLCLHHHSFAYVDCPSSIARWLFRVSGSKALHVCLCPRMAEQLKRLYGPMRTAVVSNAAFFPVHPTTGTADLGAGPIRVGHLGNLSLEKGLDLVVGLADALHRRGVPVQLMVAGPVNDAPAEAVLASARKSLGGRLIELGPLYGSDKERFFAAVDVFVFPTRYVNEAEPLVVFEALAHGLAVIAYGRGCIAEQVGDVGLVVAPDADFIAAASAALIRWSDDRESLTDVRRRAAERARALNTEGLRGLDAFCRYIVNACAA